MTGYGKAVLDITGRKLTIEVKTLNSKQLDLNLKIPGYFREKEWEVRSLLTQRFERGKIDFYICLIFRDTPLRFVNDLWNCRNLILYGSCRCLRKFAFTDPCLYLFLCGNGI